MYMDIRIRMDNKYELPKKMMMKMLTVMLMMSNGDSKARSTAQEGNLKTHYRQYLLIIYNKYNFTINIKSEELKLWIILRALKKVESMTKLLGSIRFIRIYCTLMSLSQLETYKLIIKNWYRLWELSNKIARNPTDGSANKPHNSSTAKNAWNYLISSWSQYGMKYCKMRTCPNSWLHWHEWNDNNDVIIPYTNARVFPK